MKKAFEAYKSYRRINSTECLRDMRKFAHSTKDHEKMQNRHGFCDKFCRDVCMRSAVEDCVVSHPYFCENYCTTECFYVGSVPAKIDNNKIRSEKLGNLIIQQAVRRQSLPKNQVTGHRLVPVEQALQKQQEEQARDDRESFVQVQEQKLVGFQAWQSMPGV